MDIHLLTTIDNPYDPFDDFVRWFEFDELSGYKTCERVALLSKTYEGMSEEEINNAIEKAMDTIVENDFTNLYRKVDRKRAKEIVKIRIETPNFYEALDKELV